MNYFEFIFVQVALFLKMQMNGERDSPGERDFGCLNNITAK